MITLIITIIVGIIIPICIFADSIFPNTSDENTMEHWRESAQYYQDMYKKEVAKHNSLKDRLKEIITEEQ